MSLHSHLNALDEVANRARNVRSQLSSCVEAVIGPMPSDPVPGNQRKLDGNGLNAEFQMRIENLFEIIGQMENQVALLSDQLCDKSVGGARATDRLQRTDY